MLEIIKRAPQLRGLSDAELVHAIKTGHAYIDEQGRAFPVHRGGSSPSVGYVVNTDTTVVSLTASTARTVLNLIAGSAVGVTIIEIGVSFDGVTAANAPVSTELCQSTQAGTGTSSSATITQLRGRTLSSGLTAQHSYTAEPTALTVLKNPRIDPNKGLLVWQFPLGREVETDLSGGSIKALAMRCNAPNNVGVSMWVEFERF